MAWQTYWGVLWRRAPIIVAVIALDLLVSGYLYAKSSKSAGFQACQSLYVADVSAPSLIAAPGSSLQGLGQLLEGETAANFFADDILDVAESQHVAAFVGARLAGKNLRNISVSDINGAVSGSRRDRTVSLCATNPDQASATAVIAGVSRAMTVDRARFVGTAMAKRTYVQTISDPSTGSVPAGHRLLSLALRVILGVLLALALALTWEALDPAVRNRRDVEGALGAPVLVTTR